jgi:hypothetical protein
MLIYQALLDAVPELPASVQPGILIDEQYGAAIAELTARAGGGISLAMPVEASGGNGSAMPTTTGRPMPASSPPTTRRS